LVALLGFLASTMAKDSEIPNDPEVQFKLFTVKIFLQTPFLNQQIEGETITSNSFPVQIGRSDNSSSTYTNLNNGYRISLGDYEPYQLSRSHFSIEQIDNEVLIKDLDSTNGTLVNGKQIGKRHAKQQTIKLKMGENEVIAGKNDSNFNFRILVEAM
jgi:pSer/pThr/pTyr-binding forkhead associated (FHA) protein